MLHGTQGQWNIVRCCDCGLVFTNPRPAAESIAEVYPPEYAPHHAKEDRRMKLANPLQLWALRSHWNYPPATDSISDKIFSWPFLLWFKAKSRNFDVFPWYGQGRLLDYGCGGGGFLLRMRELGWQVCGMDMSSAAVEQCKQQGLDVCAGDAVDQRFEPNSFDVVTLWHVLEHVPSPAQTLRQIHTVLKPNGKLILASPNFDTWLRGWLGNCWYALDLPRHLTHFSKKTITQMLQVNGFTVEKIFAQRHGQITQRSMKYMASQNSKKRYHLLSRSRGICSIIEMFTFLTGQPSRIVVHAGKTK
jgi:2-polyprenyl-3-methyl-5-hydroxy-6-metoxy-1,4-benzoquinol methylase